MPTRVAISFIPNDDRSQDRGLRGCQDWCGDSCDDWPGGPIVFPPVSEAWAAYGVESGVQTGQTDNSRDSDQVFHGCQDWCESSCDDWATSRPEPDVQTRTAGDNRPFKGFFHGCQDWCEGSCDDWPTSGVERHVQTGTAGDNRLPTGFPRSS
jgi:hypothetical protein